MNLPDDGARKESINRASIATPWFDVLFIRSRHACERNCKSVRQTSDDRRTPRLRNSIPAIGESVCFLKKLNGRVGRKRTFPLPIGSRLLLRTSSQLRLLPEPPPTPAPLFSYASDAFVETLAWDPSPTA
jgi:hypothetical protein